jgi:adenosylcobinamide kinase/adenosylcobinamide-phosphate guanylyltransferase
MTQSKAMNTSRLRRGPGSFFFITGGARSGKSRFAQELALQWSNGPVYVATARIWDDNFRERIKRHQQDRDERWTSVEEEKYISRLSLDNKVVVIDCITLWLTNFFVDGKSDIDQCFAACKEEINAWQKMNTEFIIISNEIGMGIHAETETGRRFTDLQGWVNQYIAQLSESAVLMVSGLPLTLK